jgi:hypothetical protein
MPPVVADRRDPSQQSPLAANVYRQVALGELDEHSQTK